MRKLTTEEVISRFKEVHGNKYDYSKINYIGAKSKMVVTCYKHGDFDVILDKHVNGSICPKCGMDKMKVEFSKNTNDFINEVKMVHGNKYDYSKVEYINNKSKIIIICSLHGEFQQRSGSHLEGYGCRKCYLKSFNPYKHKRKVLHDNFIIKSKNIHNNKYDYSKVKYLTNIRNVIIICKKHGEFNQPPNSHLKGKGCPICKESKGERQINKLLMENNIKFIPQHRFNDCRDKLPLPFDFYLPEYNTCIEYNGRQHYEVVKFFGGEVKLKDRQKKRFN